MGEAGRVKVLPAADVAIGKRCQSIEGCLRGRDLGLCLQEVGAGGGDLRTGIFQIGLQFVGIEFGQNRACLDRRVVGHIYCPNCTGEFAGDVHLVGRLHGTGRGDNDLQIAALKGGCRIIVRLYVALKI